MLLKKEECLPLFPLLLIGCYINMMEKPFRLMISKHKHAHLFTYCHWLVCTATAELNGCSIKSNLFPIWPVTENVCQPLVKILRQPTTVLADVAQWIERWKVASSVPHQGTRLSCRPGPQLGAFERQAIDISLSHPCFHPSFCLPCPLSKNKWIISLK